MSIEKELSKTIDLLKKKRKYLEREIEELESRELVKQEAAIKCLEILGNSSNPVHEIMETFNLIDYEK